MSTEAGLTNEQRKVELALMRKAWWRLEAICAHSHDWDKYNAQNAAEERDHRRSRSGPYGISVKDTGWLFTVKNVLDYRNEGAKAPPSAADIFWIRLSCFQGWAIYCANREAIRKEFSVQEAAALCAIDYAKHIKP